MTIKDTIKQNLCFPMTFSQGKQWFKQLTIELGADYKSFKKPEHTSPDGSELSIDLAWFGPKDADKLFISIAGTHGMEYFAGAAGQFNWLLDYTEESFPGGCAVCLIHCLNPYGAAHFSRGNENFVDLNRNFLDFSMPLRPNPLVEELFDMLFTKDMDEHVINQTMLRYDEFMANTDPLAAMTALGGGQDTRSDGLIYSGTETQWEIQTLQHIIEHYFLTADKVALIDWHTGLGQFGEVANLINPTKGSEEYSLATNWWGKAVETKEIYDNGEMPEFVGHVCHGIVDAVTTNGGQIVDAVMEFGTVDNRTVIPALLIDRWLRFECADITSEQAIVLRTLMMERFNPTQYSWRYAVLKHTQRVYQDTIAGLLAW